MNKFPRPAFGHSFPADPGYFVVRASRKAACGYTLTPIIGWVHAAYVFDDGREVNTFMPIVGDPSLDVEYLLGYGIVIPEGRVVTVQGDKFPSVADWLAQAPPPPDLARTRRFFKRFSARSPAHAALAKQMERDWYPGIAPIDGLPEPFLYPYPRMKAMLRATRAGI